MRERDFAAALRALYAAEIDLHLNSSWDAGWTVELAQSNGARLSKHFEASQFDQLRDWIVHWSFELGAP